MSKLDVIIGKQNQSLALAQQAQVGCVWERLGEGLCTLAWGCRHWQTHLQLLALAQQAQVGCGGSWVKERKARICMGL